MVTWENTFQEIADAKPEMALLPVGAIEQHSFHLPVGTDFLAAQALGERIARELGNCYLLPALPFSCSREHCDFAGTVWLKPATLAAIITDLAGAIHFHGINKLALIVAHGGNWVIKPTIRELNLDRSGMKIITTSPESGTAEQGKFAELHSGAHETSMILALRPELVKLDRVPPDFAPPQGREFFDYTGVAAVSPTGVWGAPSQASAKAGEQGLARAAKQAAEYLRSTFAEFERCEAERQARLGR
jgi:creatinine amidohydrolase